MGTDVLQVRRNGDFYYPIYFEEEKPLPQPDHVSPEDQNTKTQDLQKAMKKLGELQEEIERLKTEK